MHVVREFIGRQVDYWSQRHKLVASVVAAWYAMVAAALTLPFIKAHPALSFVDEFQYVDAVAKARNWDVVFPGDKTDEYARTLAACRGVGFLDGQIYYRGACGGPVSDAATFIDGYTTADIHSPLYYFLTAWLSWPIEHLLGVELLTAARITGALWLWLGMCALAWGMRRLQAPMLLVVALPVAVASMPVFRVTNSYITPDSLNLLAGSLILLSALLFVRGEWSWRPFALISALFCVVKMQNVFGVAAAILFVIWFMLDTHFRRGSEAVRRPQVKQVLAMATLPVVAAVFWMGFRGLFAAPVAGHKPLDPPAQLSWDHVLSSIDDPLKIILAGNNVPGIGWFDFRQSIYPSLLLWLLVAAVIATAMFDVSADASERIFARSAIASLLLIGPMMIVMFAVLFNAHIDVLYRYAMVLIPALVYPICRRVDSRTAQCLLLLLSLFAFRHAVVSVAVL